MESSDLPQQICDSCAEIVDTSYKMILKSMEIDPEFRTSIIKNLDTQKSNINNFPNGQMEPQVLLISHPKNRGDNVKKYVVVKNEDEQMEIDIEPEVETSNQHIKIYCYYEDKDEEIIKNSFAQRFQKTILSEHSYASLGLSDTKVAKVNLNVQSVKLTSVKGNLPVLRDHNYFKRTNDSQLMDNYDKFNCNDIILDHDYYEKNTFSGMW